MVTCLVLGGCVATQNGQQTDRINGYVVSSSGGVDRPVPNAHIKVRKSGDEDHLALSSTSRSGHFAVDELFHFMTYEPLKLERNQVYEVTVTAPGHFILSGKLNFGTGAEQWTFTLWGKDYDLSEDDPVAINDGQYGGALSLGGSIRRTNR